MSQNPEEQRLLEARQGIAPWRKWGPYLSERQWGTVREDYSESGDAWSYFTHDQARSRAYHWGEDGLAGLCDERQRLCFALALWNQRDPCLKERLFGLTNAEGNHGEDVKEYYFYLDSTPTHSYMKWLYKYPQREFPYLQLVETNRRRSRAEPEYELIDTGVFDENRYFDVIVEYAKATAEDLVIQISAVNRGPEPAPLHLLPTLWFRNTWTWWTEAPRPSLRRARHVAERPVVMAEHHELGPRWLYVESQVPLLFTDNETNNQRLFGNANPCRYVKDGINDCVVRGRRELVNHQELGTKVSAHLQAELAAGQTVAVRLRLSDVPPDALPDPFADHQEVLATRRHEADRFYAELTPPGVTEEEAALLRQSMAGMLWSKQYYFFDVETWLGEHGYDFLAKSGPAGRNREWGHMMNADIISMPDKWEYPWYAVWDLAFHAVALAAVDVDFAKEQLALVLRERFMHPNCQLPAYEWNFSDVNPPVHAWATLFVHRTEQALQGRSDVEFLKRSFGKLLANFTWWVNRKDPEGRNVFEGGFLGLDNIGVFDRSAPLPTGGKLEQADGTAWMALFCQNMLELAVEIAAYDETYQDLAPQFFDHFLYIANAVNRLGPGGMWDEEDGFYYDVLRLPDGTATRLKVRSLVGLLPLCATTVVEPWQRQRVPRLLAYAEERLRGRPSLRRSIHPTGPDERGQRDRGILALVDGERLRRILSRVLDEEEFLSPYGIRSLSRFHRDHPYSFRVHGDEYRVSYLPAESDSGMFGGNSNWRGPVWAPVNVLLIRALLQFYAFYGDDLKVECPTGSGRMMNLFEVAREIAHRLQRIFLPDEQGHWPVHGGNRKYREDPHWRQLLLFYEYFHGDNGAGLGASHQTGWTGLVGALLQYFGRIDATRYLELGHAPDVLPGRK